MNLRPSTASRKAQARRRKGLALALAAGLPAGALATLAFRAYRRDLELARNRILAFGRDVETAAGPIEFGSLGEGSAILVSHGLFGGFDQGLLIASALGGAFQWIAPSRFGYLYTPLPQDATPAAQARAHLALLDALRIEHAAVVGVSTGAPSAVRFALDYPDRCAALVLLSPAAWASADERFNPRSAKAIANPVIGSDLALWAGVRFGRPALVRGLLARGNRALMSDGERERAAEFARTMLPLGWRRAGVLNDVATVDALERWPVEQIRAPTLVVSAADDPLRSLPGARNLAEAIPGARLVELGTGGHLLLGGAESAWTEALAFLRREVPTEPSGPTLH